MSKKIAKIFTIFVVPHTEENTFSFKLPIWMIRAAGALLAILLIMFAYLAYGVMNLIEEAEKNKELHKDIRVQREEMDEMTSRTDEILAQFECLEEFQMKALEEIDQEQDEDTVVALDKEVEEGTHNENLRTSLSRSPGSNPVIERTEENLQVLNRILPDTSEALSELKGDVEEHKRRMAATPDIWPAQGRVTSGFGYRQDPISYSSSFHQGVDIANSRGTDIYATADGTVSFTGARGGYGNLIIIEHGYGYETYYAHLSSINVSEGQQVSRGDLIGRMGSTGRAVGTHLHYEVHVNGTPVNPMDYMD